MREWLRDEIVHDIVILDDSLLVRVVPAQSRHRAHERVGRRATGHVEERLILLPHARRAHVVFGEVGQTRRVVQRNW